IHGFVFKADFGYVMPIHDLGGVKEGQFAYSYKVERDVQKAIEFVKGEWNPVEERKLKKYHIDASEKDIERLCREVRDNPRLWVAYDVEGEDIARGRDEDEKTKEEYNVYSVQFAVRKHEAWEFRVLGNEGMWEGVRELLKGENKKVAHNVWLFDNPI